MNLLSSNDFYLGSTNFKKHRLVFRNYSPCESCDPLGS